jgi:MoaA/NifB/PqqE/SkfB family radical SAM enzyme
LINAAGVARLPVVRITGGEPLLEPLRVEKIIQAAVSAEIPKIILNTNGSKLLDNLDMLGNYKSSILIKISLDTLDESTFKNITNTQLFNEVILGFHAVLERGFSVEINTVITCLNGDAVINFIEELENSNVDIKLFGLNSFEGKVDITRLFYPLKSLINELNWKYAGTNNLLLPGNRGIEMLSYLMPSGKRLYLVDHSNVTAYNSGQRKYSSSCLDCSYYPCPSGRFSITLRSDGLLQGCRMRPEKGVKISGKSNRQIAVAFDKVILEYNDCFDE